MDAVVAQRLDAARSGPGLTRRELLVEPAASAAFLVAAGLCAAWKPGDWPQWWVAASIIALFAVASRVRFSVGLGDTVPTQLVFVPMLFVLPLGWVPLVVAGARLAARVPDYVTGRRPLVHAVMVPADAWFAIGPVVVLALADVTAPHWGDWPVLLTALAAQLLFDGAAASARMWLGPGIVPASQVRPMLWVYLVDVTLSPIGFLAAIASERAALAFLAVAPLAALLVVFAREREGRIAQALETAHVSQRLVETERVAAREREELIAGASHELQTPLAVVLGLTGALERDPGMSAERRAEAYAVLGREATRMSYLVRGFLDYTRLKAGREIDVRTRPLALAEAVTPVLDALAGQGDIAFDAAPGLPAVRADRDRLALALHHVVANALRHGDGTVRIGAALAGDRIEVCVDDGGPGVPAADREAIFDEFVRGSAAAEREGAGLGLYIARQVLLAQGAAIGVTDAPGGGARFVISLPLVG